MPNLPFWKVVEKDFLIYQIFQIKKLNFKENLLINIHLAYVSQTRIPMG